MAQRKQIWLVSMRMWVPSLVSLSGLRVWCCRKLHPRSRVQLRSGVAVAMRKAGSCSSSLTPSSGTSIYWGCGPKKKKYAPTLVMIVTENVWQQARAELTDPLVSGKGDFNRRKFSWTIEGKNIVLYIWAQRLKLLSKYSYPSTLEVMLKIE